MRVVITSAPFAGLTARQTGSALARAWADLGVQVAVVPMADLVSDPTGEQYAQSLADLGGPTPVLPALGGGDERTASSAGVLARGLPEGDLVIADAWPQPHWHDGGAGLLHALGASADRPLDQGVAALGSIGHVDLAPARDALQGRQIVLVTNAAEKAKSLTGLRGITSVLGHERRDDPATMLATDQALVELCAALGRPELATAPAAGACGGLGAAVLALDGQVLTAPEHLAQVAGLASTIGLADLVVGGYDRLEFGTKGGDLFPLLADLADVAMRPLLAVARTNHISARELRTMGVESGHALAPDGGQLDEQALTESVRTLARTWCW